MQNSLRLGYLLIILPCSVLEWLYPYPFTVLYMFSWICLRNLLFSSLPQSSSPCFLNFFMTFIYVRIISVCCCRVSLPLWTHWPGSYWLCFWFLLMSRYLELGWLKVGLIPSEQSSKRGSTHTDIRCSENPERKQKPGNKTPIQIST